MLDAFLNGILLPNQRKLVYTLFAVLGIVVGAVQAIYVATGTTEPGWLVTALGFYGVLAASVHKLAGANITGRPVSGSGGDQLS